MLRPMHFAAFTFVVAVSLLAMPAPGSAQAPPSAAEIIQRLKAGEPAAALPARRTRGLSMHGNQPDPNAGQVGAPIGPPIEPSQDQQAVDALFSRPPAQLSTDERAKVASIASARPAIDLTIYFDYNSANISPKALPALLELGKALSSDALGGRRFLVAGHTDASGSHAYNQKLSERRAAAIKTFLATQFQVDDKRLLAIGFGEEQLKNSVDPNSADNRRVQVVNLGN